jgi:NAD(P)H-dependent flavin oxidoreductase YrpB (nitropropane dioxygenase family)
MRDLMDGMPRLIQGGMGVHISGARLANVAARLGALGVVSGAGLRHIVIEEIRAGNEEVLRVAKTFPIGRYVEELLAWAPGGLKWNRPAPVDDADPARAGLPQRLSTIAAFVEVVRAKEGHHGKVGVNVMWKCALTVLPTILGAMLAGSDALLCGAGVPIELPEILLKLQAGENIAYRPLFGTGTHVRLDVNVDGIAPLLASLPAPRMMPILSNYAFPRRILDVWEREQRGARPFAFVLEDHRAGGHNAPPRNKESFGEKDDLTGYFEKVVGIGVPVYVAGSFPHGGSREDLLHWTSRGAYGIQVGSRFALCEESGLRDDLKDALIASNVRGATEVRTAKVVSPTGYPFKVVVLPGTLADPVVYAARQRVCDKRYLVQSQFTEQSDGTTRETYVCPAMPETQFVALGGDVAETPDRVCLCNALLSTAGFGVEREAPIVTLGLSGRLVTERVSARRVIEEILTPEVVAEAERKLAGSLVAS